MPTDEERAEPGRAAAASDEQQQQPGPSSKTAPARDQITRPSNKRRRNLRQTRVTAIDDDGGDADADAHIEQGNGGDKGASAAGPSIDHVTLLEDTRALQKQRTKRTGIDTATLLLGSSRDRLKASLAASGAASEAEALAAASRLSATEAALGNTFGTGSTTAAAARAREEAEAAADAEAARYVESRLAAALGRAPRSKHIIDGDDEKAGERAEAAAAGAAGGNKASLYEAPREAKLSLLSVSGAGGGETEASALEPRGAGLGGDDDARGAVGLVEVALSAEDRLANIERTEAAKQRARAAAAAAAGGPLALPAASADKFGDVGEGFRRRDLPASFGGAKKRR